METTPNHVGISGLKMEKVSNMWILEVVQRRHFNSRRDLARVAIFVVQMCKQAYKKDVLGVFNEF